MHPEIERATTPKTMAARKRQSNKPMTERKRREKINNYLAQLKTLILQKTHRKENEHCRLEKADILEMAVQYIQGQSDVNTTSAASKTSDYGAGFAHCQDEVFQCLNQDVTIGNDVKMRLYCHLSGVQGIPSASSEPNTPPGYHLDQSPATLSGSYTCPVMSTSMSGYGTPVNSAYCAELHIPLQGHYWQADTVRDIPNSSPSPHKPITDSVTSLPLCTPNGFNMSSMEWFRGYSEWCHSSPEIGPDPSYVDVSEVNKMATQDSVSVASDSSSSSVWRPW